MKEYGKELVLDLHKCDPETFNREDIDEYLIELNNELQINPQSTYWWDYDESPHPDIADTTEETSREHQLATLSMCQFGTGASIIVHTSHIENVVYINIFSRKLFDSVRVEKLSIAWFGGETHMVTFLDR